LVKSLFIFKVKLADNDAYVYSSNISTVSELLQAGCLVSCRSYPARIDHTDHVQTLLSQNKLEQVLTECFKQE
jgi:flagellar basal body rod protein FlgC